MQTEEVEYYSQGERVDGLWRTPDSAGEALLPAVIQGPGWLGLKDAALYRRYHEALTEAGFGVLVIDYRGCGSSEGDPRLLSMTRQLEDLVNGVTYLTTRKDVEPDAIGAFGSGGTGGGNAVLLAAADDRVRAVVSQVPVADGSDWLRRMRPEHEWFEFLNVLAVDRRLRVTQGEGRMVDPRGEIMVPTPERKRTSVKSDVDGRVPTSVTLRLADELLSYRPVEAAARSDVPLLVIGVEHDATTPFDHARKLYEAARGPRQLIMQRHTTHYAAYDDYWTIVTPQMIAWFERYLRRRDVISFSAGLDESATEMPRQRIANES